MISTLKQQLAAVLLGSGLIARRQRLRRSRLGLILTYHRVNDERDPFFPALEIAPFETQLDYVRAAYRVEPLGQLLRWLRDGPPGPPRVALTIDDGYADTHAVVLPRLRARGLPATLFLATGPPETGEPLWLDRLRVLLKRTPCASLELPDLGLGPWPLATPPERLAALGRLAARLKQAGPTQVEDLVGELWRRLGGESVREEPGRLSWEQVRELAASGVEIGAHTHRHYVLSSLSRGEARDEIATSLDLVRARIGREPAGFAYPNGTVTDYNRETLAALAELGVPWACTTTPGFARAADAPLELPRIYTAMQTLPLFACRLAGLSRLGAAASARPAD